MKKFLLLVILIVNICGCVQTIKFGDPRPPQINNSSFQDFEPLPITKENGK